VARILVVDDDRQFRVVVRQILEEAGFEVHEAGDGSQAIRAYRRLDPDLVLCDLFMPDQDGFEVLRQLRHESPGAKVLATSGGGYNGMIDLLPLAQELGADGALHKPFGRADLLAAVARALLTNPK
jgi:CheY-like chemotaxis protein